SINLVTVTHNRIINGKGAQNPTTTAPALRVSAGTDLTISHNKIAGFFSGLDLRASTGTPNITHVTVQDNEIQNVGRGQYISLGRVTDVTINGNRLEFGDHAVGINVEDAQAVTLQSNDIGPGGDGSGIIRVLNSANIAVVGNRYYQEPLFFGDPGTGTRAYKNTHITEWFAR